MRLQDFAFVFNVWVLLGAVVKETLCGQIDLSAQSWTLAKN
jgi:hypothetical protein